MMKLQHISGQVWISIPLALVKEIWLLCFCMLVSCIATAQKRYALVVGNSNYKSQNILKNPLNDVRLLAGTLRDCGFEVDKREDISRKDLLAAISQFHEKIKAGPCIALFYYSGHGIQYEGENYMIPVDAQVQSKSDVEFDCVNLGRVLGYMEESQSTTNIIILDACRKDPYANAFYRGEGDKGLAVVKRTPHESYIAFATAPGEVANDGSDANSPFTKALARHILEPGINIETVFKRVNNDVKKQYPKQIPWTNSSLGIDFYFKETAVADAGTEKYGNDAAGNTGNLTNVRSMETPASKPLLAVLESINQGMLPVEGADFDMGSFNGSNDESPVHRVEVGYFYLSKYEVTQAQWKAVMEDTTAEGACSNCPVTNVSWNEVNKFIVKLNQLTGERYRLPTEAEWEFAARGGKLRKDNKFSGSGKMEKYGWSYENSGGKLQPAGKLNANETGICDMSGNAAEWCSDWYDRSYYRSGDRKDPKGPSTGKSKVVRGGSAEDYEANCKVFTRSNQTPDTKKKFIGFRLAK